MNLRLFANIEEVFFLCKKFNCWNLKSINFFDNFLFQLLCSKLRRKQTPKISRWAFNHNKHWFLHASAFFSLQQITTLDSFMKLPNKWKSILAICNRECELNWKINKREFCNLYLSAIEDNKRQLNGKQLDTSEEG